MRSTSFELVDEKKRDGDWELRPPEEIVLTGTVLTEGRGIRGRFYRAPEVVDDFGGGWSPRRGPQADPTLTREGIRGTWYTKKTLGTLSDGEYGRTTTKEDSSVPLLSDVRDETRSQRTRHSEGSLCLVQETVPL